MVTHSRSASPCRLKARRGLPSRSLRGGETRSLALTLSHACMATRSHMATLCVLLPPALPCSLRALSPRPLVACCTVPAELVHQWCEHSSFASRPLDCWSLGIAPPMCMPHTGWPCLSCPCPAFVGQLAGSLSRMSAEFLPRLRIVPAEPAPVALAQSRPRIAPLPRIASYRSVPIVVPTPIASLRPPISLAPRDP